MKNENNYILPKDELKDLLEHKYDLYNRPSFIGDDPIQIPHKYERQEDIEIAAFLAATIAWGQRKMIIRNAQKMMTLMGNNPFDFVLNHKEKHLEKLLDFKHRTFNGEDFVFFIKALKNIYSNHGGLHQIYIKAYEKDKDIFYAHNSLRNIFFSIAHKKRTEKHLSSVVKGSAAKRLNMFLMWLVRNDNRGVHFGLWKDIPASALYLPLDLHTGNVSRKIGLLKRKQNDWKAVKEITSALQDFDSEDPVKYDFSLFCMGIIEKF